MQLPRGLYEAMKFIVKIIPTIVSVITGLFALIAVSDEMTKLVVFCVGAVGTLVSATVEICKANHYKIKNSDGTIVDIKDVTYDDENEDSVDESTSDDGDEEDIIEDSDEDEPLDDDDEENTEVTEETETTEATEA